MIGIYKITNKKIIRFILVNQFIVEKDLMSTIRENS